MAEAKWLEALADDERALAGQLAALSPAYAILHDLRLPGSKGNVDHVVVGPGGAFVIVGRRCSEAISYRDGRLFSGEKPLHDVIEVARVESQLLTPLLGTTVVPVVAFTGSPLPAAVPHAVEGVLVCPAELVVRMVTRAAHTSLAPRQVGEVTERALALLHNPGSAVRTESSLGVRPDPPADPSVSPVLPASPPPSKEALRRRRAAGVAVGSPAADAVHLVEGRSGRSRSLRFVAAVIAGLCLVAIGLGSLGRMLWDSDDRSVDADLSAPAVAFDAGCPAPGAGWQMTPVWPGDRAGLLRYDVELQNLDGSWTALQPIETSVAVWGSLVAQPPNMTYRLRITAVMDDGGRSAGTTLGITTPPTAC